MIETASALFGKKAVVVGEVKDIVRKVYLNNLARTLGWKPLVFFPDGCREVFRMGYRVGDGTDDNH
jgi:hypothetical protein